MIGKLDGQVAIVTGGLRGIGKACVLAFREAGANVAVFDIDDGDSSTVAKLRAAFDGDLPRLIYQQVDATVSADVARAVDNTTAAFGRIDVLVNNVGGGLPPVPLEQLDERDWDRLIMLNLKTAYLCTRSVISHMKAQRGGSIVNVSSQAGRSKSELGNLPYASAKAAILGFTRQLAQEMGPFGIRVNAVAPGVTLSDRVAARWEACAEEEQREMLRAIPLGRLGRPEEIASVILFLASEDSSYITGATIDVNGGRFMM